MWILVVNYFKIFRYPYSNIEKVESKGFGIWEIGTVHLKESGYFGKKSKFIIDKKKFSNYFEMFPEHKELFENS